jgi:hypothetical protein
MNYQTIDEIFEGNDRIRARLKDILAPLTDEQVSTLPDPEKWTVAQIVEHIAIVDESTVKICAKLLKKAQVAGRTSNGAVVISDHFLQKGSEIATMKVEAPSFVQPTGTKTVAESLARLDATAEHAAELRELFNSVDGTEFKFPHPFFGDISAQEWMALKGGHEMRHVKQIEKLLAKVNEKDPGHEEGSMTGAFSPS